MQNNVQLCCTETEMWFVGSLSVFLSSHQRISWMWRSRQVSSYLSNLTVTLLPCKRPLLTFVSSWVRRRKGRSTWTSSSVWRRQIPNFLTSQSCFLLSNWFSEFERRFIDKPMVITEHAVKRTAMLGLGSELYPNNVQHSVCSTKILLDSFTVFLENAKIEPVKERLC